MFDSLHCKHFRLINVNRCLINVDRWLINTSKCQFTSINVGLYQSCSYDITSLIDWSTAYCSHASYDQDHSTSIKIVQRKVTHEGVDQPYIDLLSHLRILILFVRVCKRDSSLRGGGIEDPHPQSNNSVTPGDHLNFVLLKNIMPYHWIIL